MQRHRTANYRMTRSPRSHHGFFRFPVRKRVMAQSTMLRCRRQPKYRLLVTASTLLFFLAFAAISSKFRGSDGSSSYSIESQTENKKCALLFFGLIKESFSSITLPSIQKNILHINPQCDIYLHVYNLTQAPTSKRNLEFYSKELNVSEAYLLTNHVIFEEMETFDTNRKEILERTRKKYSHNWGECCGSHDNMIKQWNSIEGVWDLMHASELQLMEDKQSGRFPNHQKIHKEANHYYEQVGLFRSDVFYTRPIDIFDSQAAVPNFAHHGGINDRLFYGSYDNAKIWASQRFAFVDIFEEKYIKPLEHRDLDAWSKIQKFFGAKFKDGYHSESFLMHLLNHYGVRVELRDHCVWRVRTGKRLLTNDCDGMMGFSTFEEVRKYGLEVDADVQDLF